MTTDEKYEIANFESEALKKNIEEGRIKSDSILETLRVFNIHFSFLKVKKYSFNENNFTYNK